MSTHDLQQLQEAAHHLQIGIAMLNEVVLACLDDGKIAESTMATVKSED